MKESTAIKLMKRPAETLMRSNAKNSLPSDDYTKIMAKIVEPLRASIVSLLHSPIVALGGNKVQMLFTSAIAVTLGQYVPEQVENGNIRNISFAIGNALFALIVSNAFFGSFTANTYARTKRHLRKKGELSEDFVKTACQTYCTAQGVYLAAEEAGVEKELHEILSKHYPITNIMVG